MSEPAGQRVEASGGRKDEVRFSREEFEPPRWLRNGHLQTIGTVWPRRFPHLPAGVDRVVEISPGTKLRLACNFQDERSTRPALLLVHGLEGSSDSQYLLGIADKAWAAGFSAVRMNIRNCGGTEHMTPKLYNAGLSEDIFGVIEWLAGPEGLGEIHLAGYSMGGNTMLKLAGEWGNDVPEPVRSLGTVSPSIDLDRCADALHRPSNFLYERRFVRGLKDRMRLKSRLYPELYQTNGLERVGSVREFDDKFTAPLTGYGTAANYYYRASALRVIGKIRVPTLILAAQDDPFIPVESFFDHAVQENPHITLLTPRHGGHGGFIQRKRPGEDSFWAENRIVEFARLHSPTG